MSMESSKVKILLSNKSLKEFLEKIPHHLTSLEDEELSSFEKGSIVNAEKMTLKVDSLGEIGVLCAADNLIKPLSKIISLNLEQDLKRKKSDAIAEVYKKNIKELCAVLACGKMSGLTYDAMWQTILANVKNLFKFEKLSVIKVDFDKTYTQLYHMGDSFFDEKGYLNNHEFSRIISYVDVNSVQLSVILIYSIT